MSSDENKAVVRRLAQAINSGNFEDLDNVLSPDYVRHDPNPLLEDVGLEEYKTAFLKLRNAFPDAKWTLEELLSDGDRVIGRWTFCGTQTGAFFNIPPSGKKSDVPYPGNLSDSGRDDLGRLAHLPFDWALADIDTGDCQAH